MDCKTSHHTATALCLSKPVCGFFQFHDPATDVTFSAAHFHALSMISGGDCKRQPGKLNSSCKPHGTLAQTFISGDMTFMVQQ